MDKGIDWFFQTHTGGMFGGEAAVLSQVGGYFFRVDMKPR
jgi:hypothetical protein